MKKAAKKFLIVCLLLLGAAASAWAVQTFAYWIAGTVPDATGVSANGRTVVFYATDADLAAGRYAQAIIGGNAFMINAYDIWPLPLTVGAAYKVSTVASSDGYSATGEVTISGVGWDEVRGMALALAGGVTPAPQVLEPPPTIKLWFGNRLYQPALVTADNPFIVSERPTIKAQVSIADPYTIASEIDGYGIVIDEGTESRQALSLRTENVARQVYATGTDPAENKVSAMSLEYSLTEALTSGSHVFSVSARSSGLLGTSAITTYLATVETIGGPLRIVGQPITYPSPFSIRVNGVVTIQYSLSRDGDIQIVFSDISGRLAKTMNFDKGREGGSAGVNKATWDGKRDNGMLAGNGIYLGTIISREDSRKLGTVKLAVVD